MMKKIVITGAFGKSGRYFVEKLIDNSDTFSNYLFSFSARKTTDTSMIKNKQHQLNYEICLGDLIDINYMEVLCNGIDTLVHIAGIDKSLGLVDVAIHAGVKRIILVHTTGIYSKYKSAGEKYRCIEEKINQLLKGRDITLTILRPTMIYGDLADHNMSVFIKMVDKLKIFPVVNHAAYQLQPVWAKDLGEAYYRVLINPEITANKNYILSGRAPIYLIDIFKIIENELNRKNYYISIPFPIAYMGAWIIYIISFMKVDFREKVQRLVEPRMFSFEDAQRDFGYCPATFNEGIKEEIRMYLKHQESE